MNKALRMSYELMYQSSSADRYNHLKNFDLIGNQQTYKGHAIYLAKLSNVIYEKTQVRI